jgi:hypothetical protein
VATEPVAAEAAAPAIVAADAELIPAEIVNTGAAEVAVEPVAAIADAPLAAEPEPPPPEPLVKPILIGTDGDVPAERKRGWWRR